MRTSKISLNEPAGFTLVELLTVIAIIAILAGLVLQTAGYVQKKAARSRAEAEIAAIGAALESYKADNGAYPETDINSELFTALTGNNWASGQKSYLEYQKGGMFDNGTIIDPFGNLYEYRIGKGSDSNGKNQTFNPTYDLWSTAGLTTARSGDAYKAYLNSDGKEPTAQIKADYLNLIKNW